MKLFHRYYQPQVNQEERNAPARGHEPGSQGSQWQRRAREKLRGDERPFTSSAIAQVATAAHKAGLRYVPEKQANKKTIHRKPLVRCDRR